MPRGRGRANWKLTTLLRTRQFYNTAELVKLYKTHVLPTLEFSTPAVYHASNTVLDHLDKVQRRFLREVNLTAADALLRFNLAPLQTRRDIALLGLVHRTVLGKGPAHFRRWFFPAGRSHAHDTRQQRHSHSKQLYDHLTGDHTELLRRSPLGLARVYNSLAQNTVDSETVSSFQRKLQEQVKAELCNGSDRWEHCLNPRT